MRNAIHNRERVLIEQQLLEARYERAFWSNRSKVVFESAARRVDALESKLSHLKHRKPAPSDNH